MLDLFALRGLSPSGVCTQDTKRNRGTPGAAQPAPGRIRSQWLLGQARPSLNKQILPGLDLTNGELAGDKKTTMPMGHAAIMLLPGVTPKTGDVGAVALGLGKVFGPLSSKNFLLEIDFSYGLQKGTYNGAVRVPGLKAPPHDHPTRGIKRSQDWRSNAVQSASQVAK